MREDQSRDFVPDFVSTLWVPGGTQTGALRIPLLVEVTELPCFLDLIPSNSEEIDYFRTKTA